MSLFLTVLGWVMAVTVVLVAVYVCWEFSRGLPHPAPDIVIDPCKGAPSPPEPEKPAQGCLMTDSKREAFERSLDKFEAIVMDPKATDILMKGVVDGDIHPGDLALPLAALLARKERMEKGDDCTPPLKGGVQ